MSDVDKRTAEETFCCSLFPPHSLVSPVTAQFIRVDGFEKQREWGASWRGRLGVQCEAAVEQHRTGVSGSCPVVLLLSFFSFLFSPSHEEIYLAQSLAVCVLKLELYAVWLQDTVFGYIIKAPNWNIRECDELFQVRPDKLAHWFLCHSHVSKYSRSFSGFVYRGNLTVSETDKQK